MLLDKKIKLFGILFIVFSVNLFAAPDLSARFLDKAEEAYENNDIESAYKNINQALAVAKDEESKANVLFSAKTIYAKKLENLLQNYDEVALMEIQTNLEKYPNVTTTKITKLIKTIEITQRELKEAQAKAAEEAQRLLEEERFIQQQEFSQAQTKAIQEQSEAMKEQSEAMKEQSETLVAAMQEQAEATKESQEKLASGLELMKESIDKSSEQSSRSATIMIFAILGVAILILIIVFTIIAVAKKAMKQQQERQEQYMQAFKMIAANQNQTNRLMLGGITDIYNSNGGLKLAGSSTWAPAAALPDVEQSPEEQIALKELAIKCEELGSQIDSYTGRKNNSKNVSELVYKLSMQLGLPQGASMLNFCAAMIYDAGFLGLDSELLRAETVTDEQKEQMKSHVTLAEKYLDFVPKKYWDVFFDASQKHHENLDGTGYPNGLKGDEIPQIARLIRVAESYVSLSSKRNYRGALDKESAIQKLKEKPEYYDIAVVECLDAIM